MKKLLFFGLLFLYTISFAQLDREHWFAPMVDRSNQNNPYQSVYMSTNETTPFVVEIFNNNSVIATVTLSKGNPKKFSIPRNNIITSTQSNLFKPISMGIYLKGERPFFDSLRFSVNQHAEIVTSKGTAGIGTEFYATPAPIGSSLNNVNFLTSILATENNTQVTIDNFNPTVRFSDNIVRTNFTFTLQKGQSYIIDGSSTFSQNWQGFIGAKITATQPISVTNGNFNGQYVPTSASSTDILMDQSVPIEKLGKEFVLVKGNGTIHPVTSSNYSQNMEKAFIVASVNGTNIYVNNSTTPVNPVPLNAGQPYVIGSEHYINQGNQQYNMFVRSTENIYVFQLLAGASSGSEIATGGYNYIPPLSCYLPKKIDEIGFINENEGTKDDFYVLTSPTKLNIITEAGATVTVEKNGANFPLSSVDGPYPVSGSSNWVTYSIARPSTGTTSVSGNIAITSSKAVTAGISAGDAAVGYGGYFAGFSAIPLITKTVGDCLPGVKLEVTEGFDSYLWLLKVGANYVPAPGINNTFAYEPTQAGIYAVQVKQGSCPQIQTQDFKFYNCTTYTNYDRNSCGTELIEPTFALSSQAVNPTTVKIVEAPTKGTILTNPDGTIILDVNGRFTYTANPGASGTDRFKYSFCGLGAIPDCETVQITVIMIEKRDDVVLQECSANGIATYNLSLANVSPDTTLIKSYFVTENGAQNNIAAERITAFTNYSSADGFVYTRLVNGIGCIAVARIELKSKLAPEVKENLYTKLHCDEDVDGKIDGVYKVDLATITPIVLVQASNFVVKYYEDLSQATAGLNNNIAGVFSFTANRSIWIRVDAPNGCPSVIKEIKLDVGTKFTLTNDAITVFECDNDLNNSEPILLSDYTSLFTTDTSANVQFFSSLQNAQDNTPTITAAQTLTAPQNFYYRFKKVGFCDVIGTLNIALKSPTATALLDSYTVCEGGSITLTAEAAPTYSKWEWKLGAAIISTTNVATLSAGVYTVSFTDASGCILTKNITVVDSPKPQLNVAAYNATICDTNFDGISDPVDFNTITPIIVPNFAANSGLFTVKYYTSQAFADAGGNNNLPNNFTFTTDTNIYVRVESQYCTYATGVIPFKFGTALPLITATANVTICDNDLNGTENINLNSYRNSFTADAAATVRYFETLQDAQNNTPNIVAAQAITGDRTFYYRFVKNGFCPVIGTLNVSFNASTPTALQNSYTVCQGESVTLNAETTYTAWLWRKGTVTVSTTSTATLNAGVYTVSFTNAASCIFTKNITVVDSPKPQLNTAAYNATLCDSDFDGNSDPVNFNAITPIIVPNFAANSGLFNVRYYLDEDDRDAGNNNTIPNLTNWTFSANTNVYVRVESQYCTFIAGVINFKFGNNIPIITSAKTEKECDDDFDGIKESNLSSYLSQFTSEPGVIAQYFANLADAQNNINSISNLVTVDQTGTFYIRLHKNNFCDVIVQLTINIQKSVKSDLLVDQNICPKTTTLLDAGPGFDAYLWSTGETSSEITVPVGDYWVELTTNGCIYKQLVSVRAVELPTIVNVQITGSTVTVNVTGGNPPYEYAIDGGDYQSSNVFTNVRGGDHTIYVKSADNCDPVTAEINVIELYNAITPNNDGINDVLNYSALLQKEEPFIQIFDRYGKIVFTGNQNNRYTWDGKAFGKLVATGSYWYVMKWKEPGFSTITEYSGWVLVKNRD